eukprot:3625344-Prymnesium_polylepis.1
MAAGPARVARATAGPGQTSREKQVRTTSREWGDAGGCGEVHATTTVAAGAIPVKYDNDEQRFGPPAPRPFAFRCLRVR